MTGLDGFQLDQTINDKFKFDYDKGIVLQVFNHDWTLEEYNQWSNEPKLLVNPVRDMKAFDNWFLELCSKTPWWLIPIVYFPCELWFVLEIMKTSNDLTTNVILTLGGMFYWTFAEYTLHRFFFHGEDTWMKQIPLNRYFFAFHFCIHGIHHSFPCDRYRLVFPPIVGYLIFYLMFF